MEEVKDLRLDNRQGLGAKLQELIKKVPGFEGYLDREQRRKADTIHREYLSKLLSGKKSSVGEIGGALLSNGGLKYMTELDSLSNGIDKVNNRIRSAGSTGGNFFAIQDVNTELLDRIYEYDLALLGEIEGLDEKINTLRSAAETNDNVNAAISGVKSVLSDLNNSLDGREKLLKGLE